MIEDDDRASMIPLARLRASRYRFNPRINDGENNAARDNKALRKSLPCPPSFLAILPSSHNLRGAQDRPRKYPE